MNDMNETALRAIYREAFNDADTGFEDKLFEYCKEYIYSAEYGGETAAMLFALPCRLINGISETDAVYIYAAATLEKHRGKGIMSSIINKLKKNTDAFIFLKPADAGLTDFYKKLGFKEISASASARTRILPSGGFAELAGCGIAPEHDAYTAMYYCKNEIKFKNICFEYTME